jgi:PAS domain S-box-containing protein
MNLPLRVLLVEDSPTDAALIEDELRSSGLNPRITRVETETEIRTELLRNPDIVMADYSLPGFTAIDVLGWFKQSGVDVPFILVSGTIDTETAVASMRQGATDYILKRNLTSLRGAIYRAIEANKTQRAKRAAEEKVIFLAHMLNLAQDAIIVCDFDRSRIHFWNTGAQKLYGWTADEVMGRNIDQFLSSDDETACAMIKGLLRDGEWSTETFRVLRDGRKIAINERASLARDSEGQPTAILFIHHDITERKRAEEQIRRQESLIRETGKVARIGSWEVNALTCEVFWTSEVTRIFGLPPDAAINMELGMTVFRGEDFRKLESALKAAIQDATPYDLELEITAADGTEKWVRTVGHPVVENEKVVKVHGIMQDISEQKRAADQLREQARLLDLTTDAILVSDFETGQIIYWNQGAERMHGWAAKEVLGKQFSELLLLDEPVAHDIIRHVSVNGEWNGELRERTRDGREITVNSRVTLVRDAIGKPKSLLSIHTDITDQNILKAQFLRAQRLESVGTLASGVAHDLNNILSPIILAAPLLHGDLPPDVRKVIVQTINTSARRGVDIVRQVLMFARGMKGRRQPVNCRRLIDEIASIAEETFPKSITIRAEAQPGLWPALGDSTQLQQILLNLTINARDAMPNGGTLSISARNFAIDESFASMTPGASVGNHVLLEVSDTGVGIARNIIDKIFDPFFTTKESGSGTGLGLSTLVGIVKNHGGFVSVDSEIGQGATFKVFIPATEKTSEDESIAEPTTQIPEGKGELVLLVDDEPNIRIVAETILKNAGYRVLLAADGTEAIAQYAEHRTEIAVVITDAVMPYLGGASLTRALRKLDPGIKVIGTSGHSDDQPANELKALGLHSFLTKPYDRHTFLIALHQALHDLPHETNPNTPR